MHLIGKTYGRLTIIDGSEKDLKIKCSCDCGVVGLYKRHNVLSGNTKSCGCLKLETRSNFVHGEGAVRKRTPEYTTWLGIKDRCRNPNSASYCRYGALGIKVSEEWMDSYEAFLRDMGRRPSKDHSIERVDGNKGYERDNCVWATRKQQNRNRITNRSVTAFGKTMCLIEWAEASGISKSCLMQRINKLGWDFHRAISTPTRQYIRMVKSNLSLHGT